MSVIDLCYKYLFEGTLILLGLGVLFALIFIIKAKLTVDRIIGINLIGTIVVISICLLSHLLDEAYLTDVAIIYVVMSFIAVMMLCRIYINLYARRRKEEEK